MIATFWLLFLAACGGDDQESAYSYCAPDHEPVAADRELGLGYTAQDALDAVGLRHEGRLTWHGGGNGYDVPTPPESDVVLTLAVDEILYGTYAADTGGLLIHVECPAEGLEVHLSGELSLPALDLVLPVTGLLAAPVRDDGAPAAEELTISVTAPLSRDDQAPFAPMLDAVADGEGLRWDPKRTRLQVVVGASTSAQLTTLWTMDDGTGVDMDLPYGATLEVD